MLIEPSAGKPATDAGVRADAGVPDQRRHVVFGVVAVALFIASVDQTIVATALSSLKRDLHAPVNWSSWTITIYALGQIVVMPIAGSASDQLGRRRVFLGAVACSACHRCAAASLTASMS